MNAILPSRRDAQTVGVILQSPEMKGFIAAIDADYICGRKGYGTELLVAVLICRYLYAAHTWTATVKIIRDNPRLVEICGCGDERGVPSADAMYRFLRKLRANPDWLESLVRALQAAVRELRPAYGDSVAGDATDVEAYANGQKYVKRGGPLRTHYSDPDASWGHRGSNSVRKGGGFYGYKPHALVCTDEELPVVCVTRTAKAAEQQQVKPLLEQIDARGFDPRKFIFDKGYRLHLRPHSSSARSRRDTPQRFRSGAGRSCGPGMHAQWQDSPLGLRRHRHEAWGNEVAVPEGQVQAKKHLDQARQVSPCHP
jgi:hypothetical protein